MTRMGTWQETRCLSDLARSSGLVSGTWIPHTDMGEKSLPFYCRKQISMRPGLLEKEYGQKLNPKNL